jgi:hypothetical protein
MSKTPPAVNPFSSGPGGSQFELLVATYYLTAMLKGEIPLGYNEGGIIESVKLQQKNNDNPVDDVVVQCQNGVLSIQVKHTVRFSNNKNKNNGKTPEFYDALSQCWSLYNTVKFNRDTDYFGIAFDETIFPQETRRNLNNTLDWAKRKKTVKAYLTQLGKYVGKRKYFDIFQELLSDISESPVDDVTTWDFIRHFVILPFDFNQISGHSSNDLQNKLLDIAKSRSSDNARNLLSCLYFLATEYALAGGELDCYSVEKYLPKNSYVPINGGSLYTLQKNLEMQLNHKIDREIKSRKYIPGIFTEVPKANDELRIFSDPVLFMQKIVEDLQKTDILLYNEFAAKVGYPLFKIELPKEIQMPSNLTEAIDASDILKEYVSGLIKKLEDLEPYKGKSVKKYVNSTNQSRFEVIKSRLYGCNRSLQWKFQDINHSLCLIKSQILIIKGRAASGKTNFICNFTDRTLKSRQQPSFYITGYDLSNEAVTTPLKEFLINRFNEEYDGKFSRLLPDIEKICSKNRKPLLIIIDGLNEHSNISQFAGQLEQVVEEFTSTIYIKFILTCRSENFDKRFANLYVSSFADRISEIPNYSIEIPPIHEKYMIHVYFNHFKINCALSENVVNKFIKNPLILRLFCEAYGSEDKQKSVTLKPLNNIRLDALFIKYNKRISDHFERKYPDASFKRKYLELLNELANYMICNNAFTNVPQNSLSDKYDKIIQILINEGVILRIDLPEESSIIGDTESLSFTYDEFRDYILADYLITKISRLNFDQFKELLSNLVIPKCPVAEGVGHYTFLISRRRGNQEILNFLKTLDNYEDIFIRAIFAIDDSLVTQEDIETLQRLFRKDTHTTERIYSGLINRRDKKTFPNLNIWLFLDSVAQFSKSDYMRLISPIFSSPFKDVQKTCDDIKKLLDNCTSDTIEFDSNTSLIEMIICLTPVFSHPSRDYYNICPTDLLLEVMDNHTKLTISLIKKYIKNPDSYIAQTLWPKIVYWQFKSFPDNEIYSIAKKIQSSNSFSGSPHLNYIIASFLSNGRR